MASNPGEWYEERRAEAERLEHELAEAQRRVEREAIQLEATRELVRRLTRLLELARNVGD